MIEGMKRILSGEEVQDQGKKPVKPQDLARLYETIIQVPTSMHFIIITRKQLLNNCNFCVHLTSVLKIMNFIHSIRI